MLWTICLLFVVSFCDRTIGKPTELKVMPAVNCTALVQNYTTTLQQYQQTLLNRTVLSFLDDCDNAEELERQIPCIAYYDMLIAVGERNSSSTALINAFEQNPQMDGKGVNDFEMFCKSLANVLPPDAVTLKWEQNYYVPLKDNRCPLICIKVSDTSVRPICSIISQGFSILKKLPNENESSIVMNNNRTILIGPTASTVQANLTNPKVTTQLNQNNNNNNNNQIDVEVPKKTINAAEVPGTEQKPMDETPSNVEPPKINNDKSIEDENNENVKDDDTDLKDINLKAKDDLNIVNENQDEDDEEGKGDNDNEDDNAIEDGDINLPNNKNQQQQHLDSTDYPKTSILVEKDETNRGSSGGGGGGRIQDPFIEESDSNFFAYFMSLMLFCIIAYVAYQNKTKVIALVLEGRRSNSGRGGIGRRKHTAAYRKLDTNLEEAITSNASGRSSQIIY